MCFVNYDITFILLRLQNSLGYLLFAAVALLLLLVAEKLAAVKFAAVVIVAAASVGPENMDIILRLTVVFKRLLS